MIKNLSLAIICILIGWLLGLVTPQGKFIRLEKIDGFFRDSKTSPVSHRTGLCIVREPYISFKVPFILPYGIIRKDSVCIDDWENYCPLKHGVSNED